jgi:hypothetical protein
MSLVLAATSDYYFVLFALFVRIIRLFQNNTANRIHPPSTKRTLSIYLRLQAIANAYKRINDLIYNNLRTETAIENLLLFFYFLSGYYG